jgi:Tfp pilus assembly protein PilF
MRIKTTAALTALTVLVCSNSVGAASPPSSSSKAVLGNAPTMTPWDQLNLSAAKFVMAHQMSAAESAYKQALAIAEKPPVDEKRLSKSLMMLGFVYFRQGKYTTAEPYLRRLLALAEKSKDPEAIQHGIEVVDLLAFMDTERGKYRDAEALYTRLSGATMSIPCLSQVLQAEAAIGRSRVLAFEGRYQESKGLLDQSDHLIDRIQPPVANQQAATQSMAGFLKAMVDTIMGAFVTAFKYRLKYDKAIAQSNLYFVQGRLDDAEIGLRHGIDAFRSAMKLKQEVPANVLAYIPLGKICMARGKISDAADYFNRSKTILEQEAITERPFLEQCQINLANLDVTKGQYAEAGQLLDTAKSSLETNLGADTLPVSDCWLVRGNLYQAQGKLAEAESAYRTSLAMKEKLMGKGAPGNGAVMNELAQLLSKTHKESEAQQLYADCLTAQQKQSLSGGVQASIAMSGQADLYRQQGDLARAETLYLGAIGNMEKYLLPTDNKLLALYGNLADIYINQSKFPEAETLLRRRANGFERLTKTQDTDYAICLNKLAEAEIAQQKWQDSESVLSRLLSFKQAATKDPPFSALSALPKYPDVLKQLGRNDQADQVSTQLKALSDGSAIAK